MWWNSSTLLPVLPPAGFFLKYVLEFDPFCNLNWGKEAQPPTQPMRHFYLSISVPLTPCSGLHANSSHKIQIVTRQIQENFQRRVSRGERHWRAATQPIRKNATTSFARHRGQCHQAPKPPLKQWTTACTSHVSDMTALP